MGAAKIFACEYCSLTKITPTLGASFHYIKSVVSGSGTFTPMGLLLKLRKCYPDIQPPMVDVSFVH